MAYSLDQSTLFNQSLENDGALVIDGVENGIADNPFDGISDMRNVNIVSVPGEASVGFATANNTDANATGSIVSADAGADTITIAGTNIQHGQAVVFSGGSLPAGIVAATTYWVVPVTAGVYHIYTDYGLSSLLNITSDGTGTYATTIMGSPKYFTHIVTGATDSYFMVDANGLVWSNFIAAPQGTWRYTGNIVTQANGSTHGNGIVAYIPSGNLSTSIGYIFVFRDFQIDYATITSNTTLAWTYGWNPATGTSTQVNYLKTKTNGSSANSVYSHEAMVAPDNRVYYCDANYVGRFYQTDPTGSAFDPTNTATYTFDNTSILPYTDTAQCIAFLGTNILVGGKNNIIYPWDRFSNVPNFPILISEYNIQKMVTVNTNTYIFVGNRGRIYITNGSQSQLYKKMPDHLSGTIEPYYTWGGATSNKNQLYFSASVTTNAGVTITTMGGLWGIDLDTKAQRITNQLSYGTYAGYATAIIPNFSPAPAGTGLYIGWDSGVSTYGIDTTTSTPYTSSQAYIDSDLIPIGTFLRHKTFENIEFKLGVPMVANESVALYYRLDFSQNYTLIPNLINGTTTGAFSGYAPASFENAQWVQFRIVLNSTASNPSYVPFKQLRIK